MTSKRQSGFTLVELMIAMVLGLLVTAAVLAVFIQAKRSSIQNSGAARMQENARFAMQILREDLQHADFFTNLAAVGEAIPSTTSSSITITDTSITIGADCTGEAGPTTTDPWVTQLASLDQRIRYDHSVDTTADATALYGCISDGTDDPAFKPNTNILAIKRLRATRLPFDTDDDGAIDSGYSDKGVYLRSNGTRGELFYLADGEPTTFPPGTYEDWQYLAHIYYLGDDHVLYREYLADGVNMTREALIDDVEYFHVQFGVDDTAYTQLDGIPNFYTSNPGSDMKYVISARIWLLMRVPDKDPTYTDTNTYVFDDVNVNTELGGAFDTSVRHRVYTTTVRLENIRNHFTLGQ